MSSSCIGEESHGRGLPGHGAVPPGPVAVAGKVPTMSQVLPGSGKPTTGVKEKDDMKRHAATGFWTVLTLGGVLLCVTAGGPAQAGTWTSNGPYGGVVVSLLIDPTNPQVVYAGTEGPGVVKTTDGGATWIGVNDGLIWNRVRALAFEPGNPATIYAGTLSDGVCKSTSSGASWSELNDGLPPECLAIRALHVAPTPVKPGSTPMPELGSTPRNCPRRPRSRPSVRFQRVPSGPPIQLDPVRDGRRPSVHLEPQLWQVTLRTEPQPGDR